MYWSRGTILHYPVPNYNHTYIIYKSFKYNEDSFVQSCRKVFLPLCNTILISYRRNSLIPWQKAYQSNTYHLHQSVTFINPLLFFYNFIFSSHCHCRLNPIYKAFPHSFAYLERNLTDGSKMIFSETKLKLINSKTDRSKINKKNNKTTRENKKIWEKSLTRYARIVSTISLRFVSNL